MCVVSMVTDFGQEKWTIPDNWSTGTITTPSGWRGPTKEEWEDFVNLVKKALDYDKRNNEPKCIDPKKAQWLEKMSKMYDTVVDKVIEEAIKELK